MTNAKVRVRIPQLGDIGFAIRLYYSKTELSTADIIELFNGISRSTASKLKDLAREIMREKQTINYNPLNVNTNVAFMAWGLDITDLEKRYAKLRKYGG